MFVAIESHIRDKSKRNTLSPKLFSRHPVAMLANGSMSNNYTEWLKSSISRLVTFCKA